MPPNQKHIDSICQVPQINISHETLMAPHNFHYSFSHNGNVYSILHLESRNPNSLFALSYKDSSLAICLAISSLRLTFSS